MADSYAAVADVEAYAQVGAYTTTTKPTLAQVQGFLDSRAAEVYAVLVEVMGSSAVGPVGATNYTNEIVTTTDRGFALNRAAVQGNAMLAAADALMAAGAGESPGASSRAADLLAGYYGQSEFGTQFGGVKQTLLALAESYLGEPQGSTHLTDGTITQATIPTQTEQGYVMTSGMEF